MNTIDDLRSTLESHSHDAAGLDPVTRSTQLKGRIAAARRRRNAVRGGVAVATVAAVAGAVLVPTLGDREPAPASRTVLGMEAPTSVQAPDHRYRFVEGYDAPGSAELEVEVEASDQPRILTWATAGEDQEVVVEGPHEDRWTSARPDFQDWVPIPEGFDGTVTVRSAAGVEGVGAALYAADPSRLPDVVEGFHGQYFRAEGPVSRRIAAVVGEPGQTELFFPYMDAGTHVTVEFSCEGLPAGLAIHADVAGAQTSSDTDVCVGDHEQEESGGVQLTKDLGLAPGYGSSREDGSAWPDGQAHVWVTKSLRDDTPVDPADYPDARIAAAVYVPLEAPLAVDGIEAPPTVWEQGHVWNLVRTWTDVRGEVRDVSELTELAPVIAQVHTGGTARQAGLTVGVKVDGRSTGPSNVRLVKDAWFSFPVVLQKGTRTVETTVGPLDGEPDSGARQHLLVYRLAR